MKRMNLLPPELRPREGGRRGTAYAVVGALFASVVAMLVYGIVIGGVRSDETELASLKDETSQAQARADALSPYGEFANMKDQRERSIRTVADTRFNYERLTRELARILPSGVWVGHVEVAPAPPEEDVVEAGADSVEGSPTPPPAMTVSGCAPSQDVVADTLDRLRALTGATNVALGSSSRAAEQLERGQPQAHLVSGGGASRRATRAAGRVAFDATVTLTAPGAERDGRADDPPRRRDGNGHMSARDKKLLMIFVPVAIFAIYWLLLLNPALDRREGLQKPLEQAQVERDKAVAPAHQMTEAKVNYKQDYAELVKLSKAIPQSVAVSDLMRELNKAARGMGIEFSNITMAAADRRR